MMTPGTNPERARFAAARRWVVKIGSALLTNDGRGVDRQAIEGWVRQMAGLHRRSIEIVLVSSGAVAEGMTRLGWTRRPHEVHKLQAAAAVGQMGLVQVYEQAFQGYGTHTAQILLTREDLASRERYLNARTTLCTLLRLGVVPIVNENDTVATDEIRLGDNDTLAGLVCNLVEAELLVILTDQEGFFSADPRLDSGAELITLAEAGDVALEGLAGGSGAFGRGGMQTKLAAAKLAARSGTATIIASGRTPDVLGRVAGGDSIGTLFKPPQPPLAARKQWLAGQLRPRGILTLDAGAVEVLRRSGRSLLAVGVSAVAGTFRRGEVVSCVGPDGREVARGLVNYDAAETDRIKGQPSDRIEGILGYVDEPELIHRDNLVLV